MASVAQPLLPGDWGQPVKHHRPTRAEQLQAAWDAQPDLMAAEIEFRPFSGWWAQPNEARHFGDEGEWLGNDWRDALDHIKWLAGK